MASIDELFAAIDSADVERIRTLLADEPSLSAARDDEGVSALMRARYRDDGLAREILVAGLELDVFEAATFGDLDRLTQILDDEPSLASARSGDGFTALHSPPSSGSTRRRDCCSIAAPIQTGEGRDG